MNKLRLVILALGTVFLFTTAAFVGAADGNGAVRGTVVNRTAGGGSVAGLEVSLTTFSGTTEKGKQTTRTDQEGKYAFEGLGTTPELAYQLQVQYQGVEYLSHPVFFQDNATEQTVPVQVFETTSDPQVVKAPARHYLLQPATDGILVSEIAIMKNESDRVYVGSQEIQPGMKETMRVVLPAGAQDVQYGQGMVKTKVVPIDGGFVDTLPVYPGDSQRIFRYRIAASGDSAGFSTKLTTQTDKVNALVPDVGVQVTVTNLPDKSNPDMQGEKYLVFGGQNLAPGTELQFKVDQLSKARPAGQPQGQPQGQTPASQSSFQSTALPLAGGAVLALGVAGAVLISRRRRAATEDSDFEDDEDFEEIDAEGQVLDAERERLVAAIARLDDAFEQGKIGAEEYGRLRAEKKRQLVAVVAQQRDTTGGRH